MFKIDRLWLSVCLSVLALLLTPPASVADTSIPAPVAAAISRLTQPLEAVPLPPIPANPVVSLVAAVNTLSASLGFPVDHGTAIWASGISPEYAGRVALVMQAVLACRGATTAAQRLNCAVAANDAAAGVIRTEAPAFRDIQAWPALFIDGDGGYDFYVHDYTILIDRGGNDTYDNNAGGNLQDIRFGPAGSAAPNVGRAIGCEQVQGNFPAPTATAHDCIAAPQVVFIDEGGYDTYGIFKAPRTVDNNPPAAGPRTVDGDCTASYLIRRIAQQGSGFEGNGLLINVGGNDRYRGKTLAQGSGHNGGVGVLRDLGYGYDDYLAIRNSQGFSLIGTLGLLQDAGGNDRYHTYMPAPLNPLAPFQTNGSGGVIDDNGVCDNLARMVQGTALLGGVGHLLESNGQDVYVGARASTQPFPNNIVFAHASQGFGCDAGTGFLRDVGGDADSYREGPADRVDGASITQAQTPCFAAPGVSVFRDDGP